MSVFSRKNKKATMNELNQESARDRKELSVDALENVVGSGDPYATSVKQSRSFQSLRTTAGDDKPIVLPELP